MSSRHPLALGKSASLMKISSPCEMSCAQRNMGTYNQRREAQYRPESCLQKGKSHVEEGMDLLSEVLKA